MYKKCRQKPLPVLPQSVLTGLFFLKKTLCVITPQDSKIQDRFADEELLECCETLQASDGMKWKGWRQLL
jgi:hypothetical protein